MELYKSKLKGAIFRKSKDPTVNSEEVLRVVKKGELVLVEKVGSLTDKNLSFPYKKYTLWNGNYAISINPPLSEQEAYVKASFADFPEHLFVQIQKPKVYITLGFYWRAWQLTQSLRNDKTINYGLYRRR
jgi:hypothetical protein